jgi:diguanylate cyclase (GGDEF)-like protein
MQNRSKTITLRTTPLSDSLRDRLVRLALERGWVILHERDSSQFDVAVRAAEDAPSQDQSGKLAETWWLEGSWVIILPPGATAPPVRDRDLVQYLPEGGDDALWIAVIENAARVGRALASRAAGIAQLHHVSTIDALTQVYNRAHLIDVLGREFKRFQRTGQPLSCIMIDLDHFKNINDTYGHNFGDEVLVALAQLLRGSIRETDILGRYGGEEFLCLLPGADLEGARALAEKIRRAVEAKPFSQGFFTIDLTASFGVASTSQAGVGNHDQLLQWADRALYRAKQTGRNRVCCAGEEAERGEIGQDADRQLLTRNAKPILLIAHHFPSELAFFRELQANDAFEIVTVSNSEEVTRFLDQTMPTAALFQADLQPVGAGGGEPRGG